MGLWQWLSRKRKSSRGQVVPFQEKYDSFKKLLEANNDALELMARLEAVAEGDFVFDLQFIRSRSQAILGKVAQIVEHLNRLGDNRYQKLQEIYQKLEQRLQEEIAQELPHELVPLVMDLSQVDRRHLLQVGGKNANLGEMKNRLGLPVPEGFVLTNAAYRLLLEENLVAGRLRQLLQQVNPDELPDLEEKSRQLQELLLTAEIPARLREEVEWHFRKLVDTLGYEPLLALRSSGIFEDQEFSFAGQFLTRLQVRWDDFFPAYLEVLASQFSPRALVYFAQKRLTNRDLAMSVGCLAMIPAEASGVLFTVDPMGERPGLMLVDAAWGLGPAVVDGRVTPDRYWLSRTKPPQVLEQRLGSKVLQLAAAGEAGEPVLEPVAPERQVQAALTLEQLQILGDYALRLEEHFGEPQDIEFAVDQAGKVWLLQSRPLQILEPQEAGPEIAVPAGARPLISDGTVACFGVAAGPVYLVRSEADLADFPEGAVLVARHTNAKYGAVLHKARGMVIDIGSATSHLAILAREFKVPALVDTGVATQVLQPGQVVTVDATHMRVYEGEVAELLQAAKTRRVSLTETPIYAKLRRVMRWITPLNLTDPKLSDLTPENCRTLHDILRFAHQMGIKEMFDLAERASQEGIQSVCLKTNLPFNLHIIDLGGGLNASPKAKFVPPEAITSIPFKALWRGISNPEISWAGPIPIDMKGLYAVVTRSLTATAEHSDFWTRTFAIISKHYLNYSSRLGYHFATIDAYVSEVRNDNYLTFRFKGGAADEVRRGRRVRFLGLVLEKLDFDVEVTGDLVVGRLWKYPQPLMEEKLDLLGRLMGCARQRDMLMADDALIPWYAEAFLSGNYRFEGEPRLGSAPPALDAPPEATN